MSLFHDLLAKTVALSMIGFRIAVFLAIVPQCVLGQFGDGFGSLIGCSLGVAGYAYSIFVFQRIESRLFYLADWNGSGILLRLRFRAEAWRWHRDLVLLCTISALFGAGIGWNLTAMTHGSLSDARIIAALSMIAPFALVLWLYRGTTRYRLEVSATEG